jgi:glycosyltransferase involved in cell wall biosynthesis
LKRFADSLNIDGLFTFTDQRHAFGDLLAVADLVVVAAVDDVPAVPLGWAMAAGRPIVGSAVPAVTEFIADRSNGLLCKPGQPVLLAARIRTALNDPRLSARLADTARSQAFEVFSMRRNADQYRLFYENILADRSPGENIRDTAIK